MSNSLVTLECAGCTAPLSEAIVEKGVHRCPFCGYVNILPRAEQTSEVKHHLYNGDEELKDYEFERAYNAYLKASELDPSESKAYFGMALATNRIKYIKDVVNSRWQAICCEITDKKFCEDKNYLRALETATPEQREEYTSRAVEIDYIREKFAELERSGLTYDTFICVKVSEEGGGFTQDSVWAGKLYDNIKKSGLNPFYSEREIGDRVGEDYEALILYALYTSKSMVIVCSNEDYLRTPWVQNEYTRYHSMLTEQDKLKNSIMIAFSDHVIERIPGIHGKIQGVSLNSFDASQRINEFVSKFANAEERARKEAELKAKREAERKAKEEAEAKAREEQRAEIEALKKAFLEATAQKATEQKPAKAEKPKKEKAPKPPKPPKPLKSEDQKQKQKVKKIILIILSVLFLLAVMTGSIISGYITGTKSNEKVTVYFDISNWTGAQCDEASRVVESGGKIGKLPTATLDGYTFKGWYELYDYNRLLAGESGERVKSTLVVEGNTSITLYAFFEENAVSEESSSGTDETIDQGVPCIDGTYSHMWSSPTIVEPTCTKSGKMYQSCTICGHVEYDDAYATLNPALGGHDFPDWTLSVMNMERTCNRSGCGEQEVLVLEDITSSTTVTVTSDVGYFGSESGLIDGDWDTNAISPKSGSELVVTILFATPTEVDQIAMAVQGYGEGGRSKFEIYLWYANEEGFRDISAASGCFLQTSGSKDGAICIDHTHDDGALKGIKIVHKDPMHGSENYREIAIGKIPDEE